MKVSAKVECGIAALIDIDLHSQDSETVTVGSIADRQGISAKYLEQILPSLRQAKLIRSVKGSRGGYVIARPSSEITFRDIINALDITVLNDSYSGDTDGGDSCIRSTVRDNLWSKMNTDLCQLADSITLKAITELCIEAAESGTDSLMYYI